jgi:hypothetical protein
MYFPLKSVNLPTLPKIFEGLLTESFFLAYLSPEGVPRCLVQTVLALFHVSLMVSAHYFSLTNSEVPDPFSPHGVYRGVVRYILGKFAKLVL